MITLLSYLEADPRKLSPGKVTHRPDPGCSHVWQHCTRGRSPFTEAEEHGRRTGALPLGPAPGTKESPQPIRRVPCLPTGLLIRNAEVIKKYPSLWNISITLNKNPWPHSLCYSKAMWCNG